MMEDTVVSLVQTEFYLFLCYWTFSKVDTSPKGTAQDLLPRESLL